MLAGGLALQGLVTDWHHFGLFGAEKFWFQHSMIKYYGMFSDIVAVLWSVRAVK